VTIGGGSTARLGSRYAQFLDQRSSGDDVTARACKATNNEDERGVIGTH
jgi:hypothetical protein